MFTCVDIWFERDMICIEVYAMYVLLWSRDNSWKITQVNLIRTSGCVCIFTAFKIKDILVYYEIQIMNWKIHTDSHCYLESTTSALPAKSTFGFNLSLTIVNDCVCLHFCIVVFLQNEKSVHDYEYGMENIANNQIKFKYEALTCQK